MLKPTPLKRVLFFIITDIIISVLAIYFAYALRFNFNIPESYYSQIPFLFILVIVVNLGSFYLFHTYNIVWRFFSLYEAIRIVKAIILTYFIVFIYYVTIDNTIPRSVIILSSILSILGFVYLRFMKRIFSTKNKDNATNTIIIGVSDYINTIVKKDNYHIINILDDDISLKNTTISGIKIVPLQELESIVETFGIKTIIVSKEIESSIMNNIFTISSIHRCEIKKIDITSSVNIQNISIEDLLLRKPKDINKTKIKEFIQNKTILITGAGGSIGSEIVRQCITYKATRIILVDMSEFNLYSIVEDIKKINYSNYVPLLMSVNSNELNHTFENENIDVVIHAAAYKHVNLVEDNINSAIINNILGTKSIIDKSIKAKIANIVLISTDKAIRPTSIMGATKRVCELYARSINSKDSHIVSVRFGNVIGSSGSVIPKFKQQIENNENLTVTDENVTRYFMLIKEACELVLQASSIGKGKEIFILDMGKSIKISDLAKKMISISGKTHIGIDYIGLQKGEKLYEELLFDENDEKTEFASIIIAKEKLYDFNKLDSQISQLVCTNNVNEQKEKLWEIINERLG